MPRRARIVLPNVPHHVTQRGSRRGQVFFNSSDYQLYLQLLGKYAQENATHILGYCLMNNHVHHILVPGNTDSLARTLKSTHMRYAAIINGRYGWYGHLWQERFYSSPLDEKYFWAAMRYVERNPVKAGLVRHACQYKWSSAKAHCDLINDPYLSSDHSWNQVLRVRKNWGKWLESEDDQACIKELRDKTRRDLPCGSEEFLDKIEQALDVTLRPRTKGRPRSIEKIGTDGTVPI